MPQFISRLKMLLFFLSGDAKQEVTDPVSSVAISIGLFGYGIAGILRPITVWHVDAVYWSTLPTVKTLQGLHWQDLKSSKPLRFFWYAFGGMFAYEFFPAYIFPWLNSVSIPCLAAMHATGDKAAVLTNLFGGSINNEGLGLFNLSFDWQYVRQYSYIEATRLAELTSCRSLPSTPLSLSSCKPIRPRAILSALPRCSASITLIPGAHSHYHSCRHDSYQKTAQSIPSPMSSPVVCSMRKL